MTHDTIVLIGLRGDVHCLDRQLEFQGIDRALLQRYNVIIIGDVWGSNNLVCTARNNTHGNSEIVLTEIVLSLAKRKNQTLQIVPGNIDIAILKQPAQHRFLLAGSEHKRSAMVRTLTANMRMLMSVMHTSLKTPISVERTSQCLPQVANLCKNLPQAVWPTAFFVNGELCQPMMASCYNGVNGMELHGLLGDALQNAIRYARQIPAGKKPVEVFLKKTVENGTKKISVHHAEQEQLEQISICFSNLDIHQVNMLRSWRSKKLHWPRWKTEFVLRFGADIGRLGAVAKERVHSTLDAIMSQ